MYWLLAHARVFLDLGFVDKSSNNLKCLTNIMIYPSCLWPWRTYFASNTEVDERTNCTTQYILKKVNNLKGLDCRHTIWFLVFIFFLRWVSFCLILVIQIWYVEAVMEVCLPYVTFEVYCNRLDMIILFPYWSRLVLFLWMSRKL